MLSDRGLPTKITISGTKEIDLNLLTTYYLHLEIKISTFDIDIENCSINKVAMKDEKKWTGMTKAESNSQKS